MEHCIHLGAGAFVSELSPPPMKRLLAKIAKAISKTRTTDGKVDLPALEEEIATWADELGDGDDDDDESGDIPNDDTELFTHGDVISKAFAFINQVWCLYGCTSFQLTTMMKG